MHAHILFSILFCFSSEEHLQSMRCPITYLLNWSLKTFSQDSDLTSHIAHAVCVFINE